MAQRLRALCALAENIGLVGFQYPHGGLKTSVTVVPGNPILASVLCGLHGHMPSTDMHAHKTFIYIKYTKYIF